MIHHSIPIVLLFVMGVVMALALLGVTAEMREKAEASATGIDTATARNIFLLKLLAYGYLFVLVLEGAGMGVAMYHGMIS